MGGREEGGVREAVEVVVMVVVVTGQCDSGAEQGMWVPLFTLLSASFLHAGISPLFLLAYYPAIFYSSRYIRT